MVILKGFPFVIVHLVWGWCHSAIITATFFFKHDPPPKKKQQKSWVGVISPKTTLKIQTDQNFSKESWGGSRLGENEPEMVFPDADTNDGKHGDAVDAFDAYDAYDAYDVFKHGQFGSFGLGLHGIGAFFVGWEGKGGNPWGGKEGSHRFNGKWWVLLRKRRRIWKLKSFCYVLVIPEDLSFFVSWIWDDFFSSVPLSVHDCRSSWRWKLPLGFVGCPSNPLANLPKQMKEHLIYLLWIQTFTS